MNDAIRILIEALLNKEKTTKNINEQLKEISKRIEKLNIDLKINDESLKNINELISNTDKLNKIIENQNKIVRETTTIFERTDGTIEKVTEKVDGVGNIYTKTTKKIKEQTNEIEKNKKSLEELLVEYDRFNREVSLAEKFRNDKKVGSTAVFGEDDTANKLIANLNQEGQVTSYIIQENIEKTEKLQQKTREQNIQLEHQLQLYKQIANLNAQNLLSKYSHVVDKEAVSDYLNLVNGLSTADKSAEELRREFDRLNFVFKEIANNAKVLDAQIRQREQALQYEHKIRDSVEKTRQKEIEKTKELQHQLQLYKQQAEINVRNLTRRYGNEVDQRALSDYLRQVQALEVSTPNLKRQMDLLNMSFKEIAANAKSSGSHVLNFGEALKTAFVKFPVWLISGTVFVQGLHFFTKGIEYVNELNKALTEISIVTGKNQQQVAELAIEYNNLAKQMGVLTQDIAQASVEFYRQGLTQEEVMERVRVATQYAKISNLEFKDAAEILTATVNSMGVDIERAADIFSYLGDATATGADEVGMAFQRVGGTAGALNLEFEKVASWIAVLSSRTREGAAVIGNSIKSILARIQQLQESGYTEEDNTSVNQVAKALAAVGIQLLDAQGQFRNFGIVMDELGAKWKSLDSRTKAYLATVIAG